MIENALKYLQKEVALYLGLSSDPGGEVQLDHAQNLKGLGENDDRVFISLVNVEEERTLRNSSHVVRGSSGNTIQEPPVQLNLYALFSFKFRDYETALVHLSKTIERFQSRRFYDRDSASAANPFPAGLRRLVLDLHNLDFEYLNHLWGVLGGGYFPSVLYKVRLVTVQSDEQKDPAPEIRSLVLDARVRTDRRAE